MCSYVELTSGIRGTWNEGMPVAPRLPKPAEEPHVEFEISSSSSKETSWMFLEVEEDENLSAKVFMLLRNAGR